MTVLRSEAVTTIKRGLGYRQTQDASIIAALRQVQENLEHGHTLPSWLLVFDVAMTATANIATATLPTGFLRFHEEYPLWYVNADGDSTSIPRRNSMEAGDAYGDDDSGYAKVFVQRNATTIEVVPPFTSTTTMYLTYYKAADKLDSEITNAWLNNAFNYLVGLAGVQVAGDLRDKGGAEKFALMAKMGNASYINAIVDEELAGRPLVMGRNN